VATPVENILAQANALSPEDREALIQALQTEEEKALSLRESAYGKFKGVFSSVDEFLRLKHEELDREERK
jgi:hypothetical protein